MSRSPDARKPLSIRAEFTATVLAHDFDSGPLLLLAGPGAGKTYMLLQTIKRQTEEGFHHSEVFEATLTNAAADDFLRDAKEVVCPEFSSSSTLHYRAKGILHRHAGEIGLTRGFTVVDEPSERIIMRDAAFIFDASDDEAELGLRKYRAGSADGHAPSDAFGQLYSALQFFYGAVDWLDVVRLAGLLLSERPDVLVEERARFEFLLVDEYQDLNEADQCLVEALLDGRTRFVAAGDDDQSIYFGVRRARPEGIMAFETRYPGAVVEILPVTSRLPSRVIDASHSLICRNTERKAKPKLIPLRDVDNRADGGFVISANLKSGKAEREFVASALDTMLRLDRPVPAKEMLVLCNAKALGRELVEYVRASYPDVPVASQFDQTVSSSPEESCLEALARFLADPNDSLALRKVLGFHGSSVGDVCPLVSAAMKQSQTLWTVMRSRLPSGSESTLPPGMRCLAAELLAAFEFDETPDRVRSVVSAVPQLLPLLALLDAGEAARDDTEPANADSTEGVRFMTLHSSKGLAADFVFIPFMERSIPLAASDTEEARRLLYVAMTRARVGVVFSWAWSRRTGGRFRSKGTGGPPKDRQPSQLIGECRVPSSITRPGDGHTADELAMQVLAKFALHAAAYDGRAV